MSKSFHHHFLKRQFLCHWIPFSPLSKIRWLYFGRSVSRLSVLFHWSICPLFHQYHTVLIIVSFEQVLKPGSVSSPTLLFFFNIVLAIMSILPLLYKLLNKFINSYKITCWNFDWGCTESVDQIKMNQYLDNIESCYPWTQNTSLVFLVHFVYYSSKFCSFPLQNYIQDTSRSCIYFARFIPKISFWGCWCKW